MLSRRALLRLGGVSAVGMALERVTAVAGQTAPAPTATGRAVNAAELDADSALKLLTDGNKRWVDLQAQHPNQTLARRLQVAQGQQPFATVFSCIDSRVPPELVFDAG